MIREKMIDTNQPWLTKDGRTIMVKDMEEDHAKSVLAMILHDLRSVQDESPQDVKRFVKYICEEKYRYPMRKDRIPQFKNF